MANGGGGNLDQRNLDQVVFRKTFKKTFSNLKPILLNIPFFPLICIVGALDVGFKPLCLLH